MSGKTGAGSLVDLESLKALVSPQSSKVVDRVAKEGSVKLLPGAKRKRGSSFRQVLFSLLANLGTINTGMAFGFSAVAIPQMEDPTSTIVIDKSQASWIASLTSAGTPFGCILSGYLMDAIGRKRTLTVTQIPLITGWLLIYFATSVPMIYAGRLLVGLGSGMVGAPARVYTAEATQPHLRGMLAAAASVGVSLGVLIEYALGAIYPWHTLCLLSSSVPVLALIGSFIIPETPSWLMSNAGPEKSKASLVKLRGPTCDVEAEAEELRAYAEKNNIHKPSVRETVDELLSPATLKPFFILAMYFLIYQFSGVNPITFYAVQVFQESGASVDKYLATVITGVVRLVFTITAAIAIKRCGMRPLTFVSSVGCGLSMVVLGTYMYLQSGWASSGQAPMYSWIPLLTVMVYTAASVIGYLVVPWVMIGELYPTQVRGITGGLTTCMAHFSIFLAVKTFPMLKDVVSTYGAFWLYGSVSLLGTVFFYYCLPETKGRTLQEIEDYFSGRSSSLKKPKTNSIPPVIIVPKGNALP